MSSPTLSKVKPAGTPLIVNASSMLGFVFALMLGHRIAPVTALLVGLKLCDVATVAVAPSMAAPFSSTTVIVTDDASVPVRLNLSPMPDTAMMGCTAMTSSVRMVR